MSHAVTSQVEQNRNAHCHLARPATGAFAAQCTRHAATFVRTTMLTDLTLPCLLPIFHPGPAAGMFIVHGRFRPSPTFCPKINKSQKC